MSAQQSGQFVRKEILHGSQIRSIKKKKIENGIKYYFVLKVGQFEPQWRRWDELNCPELLTKFEQQWGLQQLKKQQQQEQEQLRKKRHLNDDESLPKQGHFQFGDKLHSITSYKLIPTTNEFLVKVTWKAREDGAIPEPSVLLSDDVETYEPKKLIKFYERKLKVFEHIKQGFQMFEEECVVRRQQKLEAGFSEISSSDEENSDNERFEMLADEMKKLPGVTKVTQQMKARVYSLLQLVNKNIPSNRNGKIFINDIIQFIKKNYQTNDDIKEFLNEQRLETVLSALNGEIEYEEKEKFAKLL